MAEPSYGVLGVEVSFARRDIRQCTDQELKRIFKLVEAEQNSQWATTEIVSIVIESDFVDAGSCKYLVTTRETVDLSDLDEGDDGQ